MDNDEDMVIDDNTEEGRIMILRDSGDPIYRITVEIATKNESDDEDEYSDEEEYNEIDSFHSDLDGIKSAVFCFLDNGGSIEELPVYDE